jgi:hypothetical protein
MCFFILTKADFLKQKKINKCVLLNYLSSDDDPRRKAFKKLVVSCFLILRQANLLNFSIFLKKKKYLTNVYFRIICKAL